MNGFVPSSFSHSSSNSLGHLVEVPAARALAQPEGWRRGWLIIVFDVVKDFLLSRDIDNDGQAVRQPGRLVKFRPVPVGDAAKDSVGCGRTECLVGMSTHVREWSMCSLNRGLGFTQHRPNTAVRAL